MSFWRKALFYLPARLYGVPFVMHLHSGDMPAFVARCSVWQRRIVIYLLQQASTVIVLSPEWADWLRGVCPQARIAVLPNPVVVPSQSAHRRSANPSMLFLGRLTAEKGFPELIEALALARRQVPDLVLHAAGEGNLDDARRLASRHGVLDAVEFHGWVSGDDKTRLLAQSWLFVLPSYHEGLPVGILEAMAHGMPFVASPVGAVPGLAQASGGGCIVPVGQPVELAKVLVGLLSDARQRTVMGDRARQHALSCYAMDVVERRLQAIYAGLPQRG